MRAPIKGIDTKNQDFENSRSDLPSGVFEKQPDRVSSPPCRRAGSREFQMWIGQNREAHRFFLALGKTTGVILIA
jgi:hypothetical protein